METKIPQSKPANVNYQYKQIHNQLISDPVGKIRLRPPPKLGDNSKNV